MECERTRYMPHLSRHLGDIALASALFSLVIRMAYTFSLDPKRRRLLGKSQSPATMKHEQ